MTFSFPFPPFLPNRTIDTLLLRRRKGTKSNHRTWSCPCTKTGSDNFNDQLVSFFLAAAKGILSLPTVTEQNDRARHHSVPAILHNSKRKTSRLTVRRRSTRWNLIATNVQVRVFLKIRSFWSPRLEERIAYINTQTPINSRHPNQNPESTSGENCAQVRLDYHVLVWTKAELEMAKTEPISRCHESFILRSEYPPCGPTPYPLIYHFGRKGTLFFTLYWQKVPLSHTKLRTLSLSTAFKSVHKSLNQIMFPWLFHSHKMGLSALIGPFTGRNDRFPYPYTSTTKSLPFHIPEAWKRYPFRAEPPRIGHYREYTGFGQKNMRRTRGRKEERGPSAPNSPPPSSYPSTLIWAPTVIHGKILLHGFGACV